MHWLTSRSLIHGIAGSLALLLAGDLQAQQFVTSLASGCSAVTAGTPVTLTAGTGVIAGDIVVVAIAVDASAVADIGVTDTRGNVYRPFGAQVTNAGTLANVTFAAPVSSALTTGNTLNISVNQAASGTDLCARASVFRFVAANAAALDARGAGTSTSAALSLSTQTGVGGSDLVYATFAVSGDPGALAGSNGANVQGSVCTAGFALCLVSGFVTGGAAGIQTIALTASNPVLWSGSVAALYESAPLFKDGFE
jgi:hypothetical protein